MPQIPLGATRDSRQDEREDASRRAESLKNQKSQMRFVSVREKTGLQPDAV